MRPATLRELADGHGLPVSNHDGQADRDWTVFQQRHDAARAAIRTPDDIQRVITEAAANDAADGAGWLEIQVDPTSYAPYLGGLRETLEAVLDGAAAAPTGLDELHFQAMPARKLQRLLVLNSEPVGIVERIRHAHILPRQWRKPERRLRCGHLHAHVDLILGPAGRRRRFSRCRGMSWNRVAGHLPWLGEPGSADWSKRRHGAPMDPDSGVRSFDQEGLQLSGVRVALALSSDDDPGN